MFTIKTIFKSSRTLSFQLSIIIQLKMLRLILFVYFITQLTAESSQILGFFAMPSPSVFIIQDSLMQGLAAAGHNVTVVSIYNLNVVSKSANYRRVWIPMNEEHQKKVDEMQSKLLESADNKESFLLRLPRTISTMNAINIAALNNPDMLRIRAEQQFDLIVLGWFFNDYQVGLVDDFKCPAVLISPIPAGKLLNDYVGNAAAPAYNPRLQSTRGKNGVLEPMTFAKRILNVVALMAELLATSLFNCFINQPYYSELFPQSSLTFAEAKRKVPLVLVAQHFSEQYPTASFPGMVDIAGIHIKKHPDPLPDAIERFMDSADRHGVIYFSLGSNVNSATLPAEKLAAILSVFRQIPQKIIWKWERDALPDGHEQPDNLMIAKWLPQDDILAHRNVRVFISHCGKGSVAEAKYHGVPVLGMAIYGDQVVNLKSIVSEGWAVSLDYASLTAQSFADGLKEILGNSTYGRVARRSSKMYRDRPRHPLDTAVYWVEYVLRWNGAGHMQSQAVDLNWLQVNSLDVIGFVLVVLVGAVWLMKIVVKIVLSKVRGNKKIKLN